MTHIHDVPQTDRPFAFRFKDRPALGVMARDRWNPGSWRGVALVENGDWLPEGYLIGVMHGVPYVHKNQGRDGEPHVFGVRLARAWLAGLYRLDPFAEGFEWAEPFLDDGQPMGAAARTALEASGVSAEFRDLLGCLALLDANQPIENFLVKTLAGPGDRAAAARAFCMANPMVASLCWTGLAFALIRGAPPYRPESIVPGVTAAKARVLSGPAWNPSRLAATASRAVLLDGQGRLGIELLVAASPVEWLPDDMDGVERFLAFGHLLGATKGLELDTQALISSSKGDWTGFARRCELSLGPSSTSVLASYLRDPCCHLGDRLLVPLMARSGTLGPSVLDARVAARRLAARLLYRDKGLPSVIAVARDWHDRLERIERAMPGGASVTWPALLPDGTVNGITLTCLTTASDLKDEGAEGPDANGSPGLHHCVVSYVESAASGVCHIVSLRRVAPDGTYARLSTAELRQSPDGIVRISQHLGRRNGPAPEGCQEALGAWLDRPVPYLPPREREHEGDDRVRFACRYDWADDEQAGRAYDAYVRFLPRDLRGGREVLEAWTAANVDLPERRPHPHT